MPKVPLSLETDPPPLLQMAPSRAEYIWPASPRLRTGAWVTAQFYVDPSRAYRRYDPEFIYEKQDSYVVAQLGAALRLGPAEVNVAIPFVGLSAADFYEKGVIDREVRKIDRADMRIGVKYAFRIERGRDLWLLTPNVSVSVPTGSRDRYEVSLGGHPVTHFTSPGRSVGVLTGLATGWRRGWWSLVFSLGALVTVPVNRDAEREERYADLSTEVDLLDAFQVGLSPFRDLSFTVALMHRRRLSDPVGEQYDLFWLAPGLRLQPYQGLFGQLGVMFPVSSQSRARVPTMVMLQAGWEFQ